VEEMQMFLDAAAEGHIQLLEEFDYFSLAFSASLREKKKFIWNSFCVLDKKFFTASSSTYAVSFFFEILFLIVPLQLSRYPKSAPARSFESGCRGHVLRDT
jgi:hypothetical protein